MSSKRLLVVVGATGSGKTDLSIRLALHYGAPILSTDSRQVYRGMPIGTAQPSADQLQTVEHHFIASHEITDYLSCGEYEVQALVLLEMLFRKYDTVIAVGGSGLYIRALCEGMDELPPVEPELRDGLRNRLEAEGLEALAAELKERDPAYYEIIDRSNPVRVLRALEVCLQTGRPFSELRTGVHRERDFEIVKIGIDMDRKVLYDRINRRVDQMLAGGLEQEARALYPFRRLNALQTVGYREFFDYFDGHSTYEEAVELIKRNSRRYAKRQLTWFRRDAEIHWFAPEDYENMIHYLDFCKS